MSRWKAWAIGAAALAALTLAVVPAAVGAGEAHRIEILGGRGAWLGVVLEDVGAEDVARLALSEERGAIVKEVRPESPAKKAGLAEGDVVLRYEGETVRSVAQLTRLVRETPPGRRVSLEVSRDGSLQRLQATLDARKGSELSWADGGFQIPIPEIPEIPEPAMPRLDRPSGRGRGLVLRDFLMERAPRKLGLEYQEVSGQLARYFRAPGDDAVLVEAVDADGPAGKAGIRAGDLILKVDGEAVAGGDDFRRAVGRLTPGDDVTLTVQRDGKPLDVKVTVEGSRPARRGSGATT